MLRPDVVEWFGTWIPELIKYGLKAIVTVLPKTALATLSTKDWQKQVVGNIVMINSTSLEEAEAELLKL